MASSSVPPSAQPAINLQNNLLKQIRSHEVAIAELNNLSSSRAIYQKNGNIYFRINTKAATESERKQLDLAKSELKKLNSA